MELFTYAQAKSGYLANIIGECGGTSKFREMLNRATGMLMIRGNWTATVQSMSICVYNGCITWPRYVGTILDLNVAGQHTKPTNGWYNFLPANSAMLRECGGCASSNAVIQQNFSPVFNQIKTDAVQILAYPSLQQDAGKTMTVFGIDENGQEIFTKRTDGSYLPGAVLTLASPFGTLPFKIRQITRVTRQKTVGVVRMFQLFTDGSMVDLASYDGQEENPYYRQSFVNGFKNYACCKKDKFSPVEALVKLQFVPVVNDDDVVQISCVPALLFMLQSLRKSDAGEIEQAAQFEAKAIRELNLDLRDKYPLDQVSVSVSGMGTVPQTRQPHVF